jgi:3-deoxy-D-manno-octulosonic-acid transferase
MQNFRDIVRLFLARDAAVQVKNAAELERALTALLENADRRAELGQRAAAVVAENLGSIERTIEMILPEMERRGMYIVPKD